MLSAVIPYFLATEATVSPALTIRLIFNPAVSGIGAAVGTGLAAIEAPGDTDGARDGKELTVVPGDGEPAGTGVPEAPGDVDGCSGTIEPAGLAITDADGMGESAGVGVGVGVGSGWTADGLGIVKGMIGDGEAAGVEEAAGDGVGVAVGLIFNIRGVIKMTNSDSSIAGSFTFFLNKLPNIGIFDRPGICSVVRLLRERFKPERMKVSPSRRRTTELASRVRIKGMSPVEPALFQS